MLPDQQAGQQVISVDQEIKAREDFMMVIPYFLGIRRVQVLRWHHLANG